jgi:hypothetical protein
MAGRTLAATALAIAWTAAMGSEVFSTETRRWTSDPERRVSVENTSDPLFLVSDTCMVCHNNLVTPAGEDVSIGSDWRATMMANSARDPYWQAAVRREVLDHPEAQAAIEDECSICHMPMATYPARAAGGHGQIFARLPIGRGTTPADLAAADGVGCAVCHQITPQKLGTPESFTGGFHVETTSPAGGRPVFGPFQTDAGRTTLMRSATGFVPTEASHVQASELCATCHTLYTTALGPNHQALGRLPEQMPYLEWRHSAYRATASCQSCHMPAVAEPVPVTRVLGQPRENVSRHSFRGGNFFMLRMLNRFRDELGVAATAREMELAIDRTIDHLQHDTAAVAIESPAASGGRLEFDVVVTNRAGHKLPSAYPSRRAWLHVTVSDAGGRTVFESGALEPDGRVRGNDNDENGARFEPHYARIERPGEVQIYEAIMAGPDEAVTTGLLTGVRYLKDNRLLPDGFDKATAPPDIAVHGAAASDADFAGGADRVRYAVPIGQATGPFRVNVQLYYQPIGFRWADNLRAYDAFETRRFVRYWDAMSGASAVSLAGAAATVR